MTSQSEHNRGAAAQTIPAQVPDHRGQPRPDWMEFFAQPPTEIGTLLSAESTLKQGRVSLPAWARLAIIGFVAAAAWGGMAWIEDFHRGPSSEPHLVAWIALIVCTPIAWFFTRFVHRCTYVGSEGIAKLTLRGGRGHQPKLQVLEFSKAIELRAAQTRKYYNGIYVSTVYNFRWVDPTSRTLFRLKGGYYSRKRPPGGPDPFNFASAAELAWSEHFLQRAQGQLRSEGSIAFRVGRGRTVRVGAGFIEFHFGKQPQRVSREEIASVSLGKGWFSFKHTDARWYNSAGRYRFQYGSMGNAKVFLLALDRLMGYRWADQSGESKAAA